MQTFIYILFIAVFILLFIALLLYIGVTIYNFIRRKETK